MDFNTNFSFLNLYAIRSSIDAILILCFAENFLRSNKFIDVIVHQEGERSILKLLDEYPNIDYKKMKGGVIGGSLTQGKLKIGDKIVIKPGLKIGDEYKKIPSEIISIKSDEIFLDEAIPGGLVGIELTIDPFLTSSDKLIGNQISASSSNRNFKGRQGSPNGRTLLMSPAMVAAAAIAGRVSDVREFIKQ